MSPPVQPGAGRSAGDAAVLLLGLLPLWLLATCGGVDALKLCRDTAQARCDKVFSCLSDAELAPLKPLLGNDASDCTTRLQLRCSQQGPCQVDETYHADVAARCHDAWTALTCPELKSLAGAEPAACTAICTR